MKPFYWLIPRVCGLVVAVWANRFGPTFRVALPGVMDNIAAQALLKK